MTETFDIQIPEIEKSLENLCDSPKKKHIKACLFTLIIYAHDPKRIKYNQELVDNILDKFPCRIIFIQRENKSNKYLHVDVSNVTSGQEGAMVVCDQITIRSSQNELSRVPYIVIPHIIPDLPVYLLWSQSPLKEHVIFPALQPYASRIIFDSECSEDLHHFSQEMLNNLNSLKMDVMDINWALISNWRDMLSQLFDASFARLSALQRCKSLRITYNNAKTDVPSHPAIRAIYLQGWLASRLKWKYHKTEKIEKDILISYSKEFPAIVALCSKTDDNLPSGAIISIELASVDGYTFFISRKPSLSQVIIHISSHDQCELPYTLPLPDVHQGLTFMKEIFYHRLSEQYLEMLNIISQLDKTIYDQ